MQMAQDLNQILFGEIDRFSSAGDDEAFLRNVVTPIYRVIKEVCHSPKIRNREELEKRVRVQRKMHYHSSIQLMASVHCLIVGYNGLSPCKSRLKQPIRSLMTIN